MKDPTLHLCSDCGKLHQKFYRVHKGGERTLHCFCDKQITYWLEWDIDREGKDFQRECRRTETKLMHLAYEDIPGLREELTAGAKAKAQKKAQLQLVMPTRRDK